MKSTGLLFAFFFISMYIQAQYVIYGSVPEEYNHEYVYMSKLDIHKIRNGAPAYTDSTLIQNGRFTFRGDSQSDTLHMINIQNTSGGFIVMDAAELYAEYVPFTPQGYFRVRGSALNEQLTEFIEYPMQLAHKVIEMGKERQELLSKNEWTLEKENEFNEVSKSEALHYMDIMSNLVKDNIENHVGQYMLVMLSGMIHPEVMNEIEPKIDDSIKDLIEESKAINMQMVKNLQTVDSIPQEVKPMNKYIDFEGETLSGDKARFSSLIESKKIILIDFWASWCAPCIKEMPELANLYAEYKDKGLEIVGISIDTDKTRWKETIRNKKMDWIQLLDSDISNPIKEIYGVKVIPYTVLIDENGIIIENKLRGHELRKRIEELLQ